MNNRRDEKIFESNEYLEQKYDELQLLKRYV